MKQRGILRMGKASEKLNQFLSPLGRSTKNPMDLLEYNRLFEGTFSPLMKKFDSLWRKASKQGDGPVEVIDMFSGCGGMSVGFKAINGLTPFYKILGGIDIDNLALDTYRENLKTHAVNANVSELSKSNRKLQELLTSIGRDRTKPLVLIGCSPCQGFSSHRNSSGEGDLRNSLFKDFASIATLLKPDAVVVENVPEILTDRYWSYVSQTRKILERAGYYVNVSFHNSAEFGVPQERFRALILASKKPFLPLRGFLGRKDFATVRDAIGQLADLDAGDRDPEDPMHFTVRHKQSTIDTIRAVPKNGGNRPAHVGPDCLRRASEKQGRGAYDDVYGRLAWDRPSITITGYARNPASGRFVHPEKDRGLSVREGALLQSFPNGFAFCGSLDESFKQIGNAVPPLFAAAIAMQVASMISGTQPAIKKFDKGMEAPIGASFSRIIPSLKAGHRNVTNTPEAER